MADKGDIAEDIDLEKLDIKDDEEWVVTGLMQLWLVEYILQMLTSPMWTIPIETFLEENCITFEDKEENSIQHFKLHKVAHRQEGIRGHVRRPPREDHHGNRYR